MCDYASLGHHRSGTDRDLATAEWFAGLVGDLGTVTTTVVEFERYDARSELLVDGRVLDHLALYYEFLGDVDTTDVAIRRLDPRSGGFSRIADETISEAKEAGYAALVIATEHPGGDLVAINRYLAALPSGMPTLLVAGRHYVRGAHLTEEEHLALGRRFGTPSIYPVFRVLGATEPTMTVIEDGPDSPNRADRWHTDVTWTATPPKAALLHMELAPEFGGDTLWASATRAYETLSPQVQEFFTSLTVMHSNKGFLERVAEKAGEHADAIIEAIKRDYGPVEHPLVRTHPETGKRALLYAEQFIDHVAGVSRAESDMVLNFVREHVADVSLHCRWQWQEGDLAIWDERSTLHRAAADHFPQRRIIRRLEIDGDRPYFNPNGS